MLKEKFPTVLVTGGTGFIGSHLVRRLISEELEVHLFVRPQSSCWRISDLLGKSQIWYGDLLDRKSIYECLKGANPGLIFHLAGTTEGRVIDSDWMQIERSLDVNCKGTLNLLQVVHHENFEVKRFIRTGGLEEYGNGSIPFNEGQREKPVSPYSASQVATTHYCQMLQPYVSFSLVTLRLALVYGAAQSKRFFIPSLISHCLNGNNFDMTSGEQSRDLIFVDDVVEAMLKTALNRKINGEIINIGTGKEYQMRDVAHLIQQLTEPEIVINIGSVAKRPSEIQRLFCQIEKAHHLLEWQASTCLEQGLARTIQWFSSQKEVENH